ncbi:flippase [Methanosarcina acetivorans]
MFLSEIKKFVSDVGITFVSSALCMFLGFPITVLLGRYLGASDLGLYRMVNTIFGTLMLFATIGIPASVIKYVAEFRDNEEKLREIISASLITSILLGLFSFSFIYINAGIFADLFNMPELTGLLKILAFAFPFSIISNTLLGLLNGLREMTKNACVSIIQSASLLIFTFLLVFKCGVNGAVIGIVLSSVLTTILLVFIQQISKLTFSNIYGTIVQIIDFGSKTVLSNAINLINYQADTLMIGYFMTKMDVGVYSVAIMFAKLIWILPDSLQRITFPLISEYHAKKMSDSIKQVVEKCMKYSCLFLIFISTFFIFWGEEVIDLIFGNEFEGSYFPLIILLIGTLFYGITKSVGSIFASIGKVSLVYKIPLVSAVLNIILNSMLIPLYGINGAALATTISLLVSVTLMIHFMEKLIDIKIDYFWYLKVLFLSGIIVCLYLILKNLINDMLLESVLMILELILFIVLFIDARDKNKIFQLFCVQVN